MTHTVGLPLGFMSINAKKFSAKKSTYCLRSVWLVYISLSNNRPAAQLKVITEACRTLFLQCTLHVAYDLFAYVLACDSPTSKGVKKVIYL